MNASSDRVPPVPRWTVIDHWAARFGWRPASLGARGELLAARWLRRMGLTIIACGERDSGGELDIVAVERRTVVFVEVKTRQDSSDASPAEAVDRDKQERITRAALRYLKRHELLNQRVRFDVIAVTWPEGQQPSMRHFRAAFEATGHASMFS